MNQTWKPNAKQQKVIDFLKANAGKAYTLAEIAENLGEDIKSGTTNPLVTKGAIKCNKNALEKVCPHCGRKSKVSTYQAD